MAKYKENKVVEITPEDFQKMKNAAKVIMGRYGFYNLWEDFAQELAIKKMRGMKQSREQTAIDFLREYNGSTKSVSGKKRLASLSASIDIEDALRSVSNTSEDGIQTLTRVYNDYFQLFDPGVETALFVMYYLLDWTAKNIGIVLGVSESSISQRLKELSKLLRSHLQAEHGVIFRK